MPAPLTPQEEAEFQRWYRAIAQATGLNPNPDDPQQFYDYRAAWKAGVGPDPTSLHWPSTFKRYGHPNRVVDGIDTRVGLPAMDPVPVHQQAVKRALRPRE